MIAAKLKVVQQVVRQLLNSTESLEPHNDHCIVCVPLASNPQDFDDCLGETYRFNERFDKQYCTKDG